MTGRFLLIIVVAFASVNAYGQITPLRHDYGSSLIQVGEWYLDNLLIDRSTSLVEDAENRFPFSPAEDRARYIVVRQKVLLGDLTNADEEARRFLAERANSPFNANMVYQRALIAQRRANFELAAELYQKSSDLAAAAATDRNDSSMIRLHCQALYFSALNLARKGANDDARQKLEYLSNVHAKDPIADDALFLNGLLYELSADWENARQKYRQVRMLYPSRNVALAARLREANCELYFRQPQAATLALSALTLYLGTEGPLRDTTGSSNFEPQSLSGNAPAELELLRAETSLQLGQFEDAIAAAQRCIALSNDQDLVNPALLVKGFAQVSRAAYQDAIATYTSVIDSPQDDVRQKDQARLYKALCQKFLGDREAAQREFMGLATSAGYSLTAVALLELGQMYYEDAKFDLARKALERAERESPDAITSLKIQTLLGGTLVEIQQWAKAIRAYESARKTADIAPSYMLTNKERFLAEIQLKLGISKANNNQYRDAIVELNSFIASQVKDFRRDEALFWLAESYFRSDLLKGAEDFFRQLLEEYPNSIRNEDALYGLAWSHFRRRDFTKSSELFSSLVKKFPKTRYAAEALARKGDGHYILKQYKDAASSYAAAVKQDPRSEVGQYCAYQLGQAYFRTNELEKAVAAFESFVRSYSRSQIADAAAYSAGWTRFQMRQYQEAIKSFEQMIATFPSSDLVARALYSIGDCYYNQGEYEAALGSYKRVMNEYPASPYAGEAVKSIQFCLDMLGRTDEALQITDAFVNANPNLAISKDLILEKGYKFFSGKNFPGAIAEYENFLKQNPDHEKNAEAVYFLGKSYLSLGEQKKASQAFDDLLLRYPKSDYAPAALLEMAMWRISAKNAHQADSIFELMEAKYPAHPKLGQALYERAMLATSLGDTVKASRCLVQSFSRFKGTEYGDQSAYQLAMRFKRLALYDSAMPLMSHLADNSANPLLAAEAQYRKGEMYQLSGKQDLACQEFGVIREKFAGAEDWYTLGLLAYAKCLRNSQNVQEARELLESIVRLRGTDEYAKAAQNELRLLAKPVKGKQ